MLDCSEVTNTERRDMCGDAGGALQEGAVRRIHWADPRSGSIRLHIFATARRRPHLWWVPATKRSQRIGPGF